MGQSARKDAPGSIVILRALQLGDLLCSVPAIRALRAAYPHARITLAGLPWAETFVQRFSAYLDDFIEFPGWPGLPEREVQIHQTAEFLREVQARQFGLALQMQGSGYITNPLVMLFGARRTAGYYLPGQYQPETGDFWPYPEGESEIRIWLKLMEHLGIPAQGGQLEFPVTQNERVAFEGFLAQHGLRPGQYACLHAGARDEQRRWPVEKFAAVGDALAEKGLQVVLTGTQGEQALTRGIAQHMQSPALDAAGATDLGALALLIANARLLVSNDTGVSHIAAAFQTPSVILFSTSDPQRWRPLDRQTHRALLHMNQVQPQQVMEEVESILGEATTYA